MGLDLDGSGRYHNRSERHEHTGNGPTALFRGNTGKKDPIKTQVMISAKIAPLTTC